MAIQSIISYGPAIGMQKVFLGTKRVQKLGRIVLDEAALRNAKLAIGDEVDLSFDPESSALIIEKARRTPSGPRAKEVSEGSARRKQ